MTQLRGRARLAVLILAGAAVALAYLAAVQHAHPSGTPWVPASLLHPLGLDEFGRDLLATAYLAGVNSLVFGFGCATAATAAAVVIGYPIAFMRWRWLSLSIDAVCRVVESLPVVIWVLLLTILAPAAPRAITTIVFLLAVLPYLVRVVAGEFARLASAPFIEAARMQELPRGGIVVRHLLPNATSVLGPALAQVSGLAIAIDGAIAIVGSAQRTQLALGIFILRAKDNALTHPGLALVAVSTLLLVFVLVWLTGHRIGGEVRSDGQWL